MSDGDDDSGGGGGGCGLLVIVGFIGLAASVIHPLAGTVILGGLLVWLAIGSR